MLVSILDTVFSVRSSFFAFLLDLEKEDSIFDQKNDIHGRSPDVTNFDSALDGSCGVLLLSGNFVC